MIEFINLGNKEQQNENDKLTMGFYFPDGSRREANIYNLRQVWDEYWMAWSDPRKFLVEARKIEKRKDSRKNK